jgi:2-iminobutanoate/2-iminopropanoate deaminase
MEFIETDRAPTPSGHYSQAIVANGMVFVAGQLPICPSAERTIPDGIEAQCEQVLANLRAILEASGSRLDLLVSLQVFVTDIGLWARVDAAFKVAFGRHKPTRTIIPCGPLRRGALIEVNGVATCG